MALVLTMQDGVQYRLTLDVVPEAREVPGSPLTALEALAPDPCPAWDRLGAPGARWQTVGHVP